MWWRDTKPKSKAEVCFCEERAPLGLVPPPAPDRLPDGRVGLAATLGVFAALEEAAGRAQLELEAAARRRGAPESLLRRCRQAIEDEHAHANVLGGLARAHGVEVPRLKVESAAKHESAVFHQNAVEGCVHSAFAAIMAELSAQRAETAELRRVYRRIADDEAGHAELAWDLYRWHWLSSSAELREDLARAQRAAIEALPTRVLAAAAHLPEALGRPEGEALRGLADRFAARLHAQRIVIEDFGGVAPAIEEPRAALAS